MLRITFKTATDFMLTSQDKHLIFGQFRNPSDFLLK